MSPRPEKLMLKRKVCLQVTVRQAVAQGLGGPQRFSGALRQAPYQCFSRTGKLGIGVQRIHNAMREAALRVDRIAEHEPLLGAHSANAASQEVGGLQIGRQPDCCIAGAQLHRFGAKHKVCALRHPDTGAPDRPIERCNNRQRRSRKTVQRRAQRIEKVVYEQLRCWSCRHKLVDVDTGAKNPAFCSNSSIARTSARLAAREREFAFSCRFSAIRPMLSATPHAMPSDACM